MHAHTCTHRKKSHASKLPNDYGVVSKFTIIDLKVCCKQNYF